MLHQSSAVLRPCSGGNGPMSALHLHSLGTLFSSPVQRAQQQLMCTFFLFDLLLVKNGFLMLRCFVKYFMTF